MATYVFAIIGMLIVIPILYFLPLGFSSGGTFIMVGIAFTAALLMISLQNILNIWTALLASIALILLGVIVLQKKGKSFMIEEEEEPDLNFTDKDHAKDDIHISEESDRAEEPDEPSDVILSTDTWIMSSSEEVDEDKQEKAVDEEDFSLAEKELTEVSEDKRSDSERSESDEVDELLISRNEFMLSENIEKDKELSDKEHFEKQYSQEESLEDEPDVLSKEENTIETDRSWLESAAIYDVDINQPVEIQDEPTIESDKISEPDEDGDIETPHIQESEDIATPLFSNLEIEDNTIEPESAQKHELNLIENSHEPEETADEQESEAFVFTDSAIDDRMKDHPDTDNDAAIEQPAAEEEDTLHDEADDVESQISSPGRINDDIFSMITLEFNSYVGSDIQLFKNEVHETIGLTSDESQQFALYRIMIEFFMRQELYNEAIESSEEVSMKFDHPVIKREMEELRNLLT
ncbi:hypothetical protein [Jeotgalibacillus salarius]|uniref:Uncharacterized protein n=1 Tax=Jeotgalibacillus salarius TaxID=546023 RepID=A0A4Y8LF95_9BACL|nr:hypothetical protein [Jeotgalibacillus salarius]TFE01013.1 hypothetical protein E2626_10120 [Jeotgalibacillus salarius]